MMGAVQSIARSVDGVTRLIAMAALFALAAVTAVDVLGRTFFDAPLGYAFELAGVLLGIAVYAGLIGVNWRRDHVKIDLLAGLFDRAPLVERLRDGLSWVLEAAFFAILAAVVLRQAETVSAWGERFYFLPTEKWVPMTVFFGLLVVAVAMFGLHLFRIEPDAETRA